MGTEAGFPDRHEVLFGREPDLAHLRERAAQRGLTAVAGRAQMGKSWLLTELARMLSGGPQSNHLVGFTESFGETSDLLLRAVTDLYTRWLSDASYWQQARVVWQQQKKDFVTNAGKAVVTIFEKLSKIKGGLNEAIGSFVKEAFYGLAAANRELLTGKIELPRLQYDQARELVGLVERISGRRVVLVVDQWEKSPSVELEGKILDAFLRHMGDWPTCHIFVGVRVDEPAYMFVKELQASLPGPVEVYDLPPMHLDDPAARTDLIRYVRSKVKAASLVGEQALLDMIAGYPGTIYRWTSEYNANRVSSQAELANLSSLF